MYDPPDRATDVFHQALGAFTQDILTRRIELPVAQQMEWSWTSTFHYSDADQFIGYIDSKVEDYERYSRSLTPIEAILWPAIVFGNNGYTEVVVERDGLPRFPPLSTTVRPQVNIRQYRVDFLFTVHFEDKKYHLVVECDGHDYHERTKEQAQRDKSRDRELLRMGYSVIRFTGSEIYRDPFKCMEEITAQLSEIYERHWLAA